MTIPLFPMRTLLLTGALGLAALAAAPAARAQTTAAPPAAAAAAVRVAGTWTYLIDTPNGAFRGTMTFAEADRVLTGTVSGDGEGGPAPLLDVQRLGRLVTFRFEHPQYGPILYRLTVAGDTFEGTATAMGYDVPVTGARKPD